MVHPHLNYGLLVWGFNCSHIAKLQKRAIRTITISKYNAHTTPLFKKLEILNISDMLRLNVFSFYYKFVNKKLPIFFNAFVLTTQGSLHEHDARQRDNLRPNRTRINMTDRCLRNYLPKQINSIPNHLSSKTNTHSSKGFSSAVKMFFLNNYSVECTVVNCYICQLTITH